MKLIRQLAGQWVLLLTMTLAGILVSGCRTNNEGNYQELPGTMSGPVLRSGDTITVNFSGVENPIPAHTERIKEDGTITLDYIGPVHAAGRTAGQLQKEIRDLYVPKYYRDLTVTVTSAGVYWVGGEVRSPGSKDYLGQTDIVKAIQAAGDFTEFANKKKVLLTRANGHQMRINVLKAIEDPSQDVMVYPGDRIVVPRRLF